MWSQDLQSFRGLGIENTGLMRLALYSSHLYVVLRNLIFTTQIVYCRLFRLNCFTRPVSTGLFQLVHITPDYSSQTYRDRTFAVGLQAKLMILILNSLK